MKLITGIVILASAFGGAALADDQGDRQKLIGSWELQTPAPGSPATAWTFSDEGKSLRIAQMDGTSKIADFACKTEGSSCEIKTSGKRALVSLWFNGPRLVEMETKGSDVVKRRFMILPKDDVMEMEIIPIVPGGKTETFRFKRTELSARQK